MAQRESVRVLVSSAAASPSLGFVPTVTLRAAEDSGVRADGHRTTYLTIGQAAKHLGLAVDTVRRLEAKGELRARRTPGGHRRFSVEAVEAFRAKGDASPTVASRVAPRTSKSVAPSRRAPTTVAPRSAAFTDLVEWNDVEDGEADDWDEWSPPTPAIRHPLPPEPQTRQVSNMDSAKTSAQDRQRLDQIKAHGTTPATQSRAP